MATLDELRLQQLLSSLNNQNNQVNNTGITGASSAIPNINGVPMINTGALFNNQNFPQVNSQVPQINNQVNNQVPFNDYYGPNIDTSFGVANEEDEEQKFSIKDSLSGMGRKFGLSSLIGLITGNPLIGLLSKGIGALADRAGPGFSDFKNASTGAQFFQNLRDRRARNDAAARGAVKANMADARAITNRINTGRTERGPNENSGSSSNTNSGGGTFGTSSNNNSSFSDYS